MSAVALAGLSAAWALRRNRAARSARPHQRPAAIPAVAEPTIRELASRDVGGVAWMAAELRLLASALPEPARATLSVQLVQLELAGELEVAFIEIPSTPPPAGWMAAAERAQHGILRSTPERGAVKIETGPGSSFGARRAGPHSPPCACPETLDHRRFLDAVCGADSRGG